VNKYEDIVMPEQHHHLANKYEDIVDLQGRKHIVAAARLELVQIALIQLFSMPLF